MKSVWQALIWKEWHEHKWKLVALMALLIATHLCSLLNTDSLTGVLVSLYFVTLAYAFFVPMFIAADDGSNEVASRTLPFLQSQPVPLWKVGLLKLIFGYLVVLAPILMCFATVVAITYLSPEWKKAVDHSINRSGIGEPLENVFAFVVLLATSIYIWSAAIGVNRGSLVSAAARILACILGIWVAAYCVLFWGHFPDDEGLFVILPGGLAALMSPATDQFISIAITGILLHGVLAYAFVRRFGTSLSDVRSPQEAHCELPPVWLAPPRRNPVASLIWKQFRESIPIVATALAASLGISGIMIAVDYAEVSHLEFLAEVVIMPAVYLSFFAAIVVGVGLFYGDLSASSNVFWRSRPINPHLFFWIKFVTGLVVLYGAFSIPSFLVLALGGSIRDRGFWEGVRYLAPLPFLGCVMSAMAVAFSRNAVFACIVGFGGALAVAIATYSYDELRGSYVPTLIILGVSLLATLLAWLAVRYDWSLRR